MILPTGKDQASEAVASVATHGIGRRLWIALIASAGISLIVCLLALAGFQFARSAMRDMTETHQRRVDAMQQVGRTTQNLVIAAQALVGNHDNGNIDEHLKQVQRAEARVAEALLHVRSIAGEVAALQQVETINRRLSVQLQLLVSAAGHAAALRRQADVATEQLRVSSQELRLALTDWQSGPESPRLASDLVQVFAELTTLEQSGQLGNVARARVGAVSALAAAQSALARMPANDPVAQAVERLPNVLLGETGLLNSIEGAQAAQAFLETRLTDIRRLNESMHGASAMMSAAARGELVSANAQLQSRLQTGGIAMILLAALGIGGSALFAWRYVGRNLIARLNKLQRRMLSLANGDFDSPIIVRGGDEIAAMAKALLVFRAAMQDMAAAKAEATTAHERLTAAVESLREGFALFDDQGKASLTNTRLWSMLPSSARDLPAGWTLDTMLLWLASLDHPPADRADLHLMDRLAEGEEFQIHPNIWIVAGLSRSPKGEYVFVVTDVTRLKEREAEVQRGSDLMNVVFDQLDQGIGVYNRELVLEHANGAFAEILGLPPELGQPGARLEDIYRMGLPHGLDETELHRQITKIRTQNYERRVEMKTRAGRLLDLRRGPMPEGGYVVSFTDITEERRVRRRMQHLVNHDAVTDLLNRLSFEERLKSHLTAPRPDFAVAILSVTGFKDINDTFGRDAGDMVLRHAATALQSQMPHDAAVARLGADDFAVLIPHAISDDELERIGRDCVDAVTGELAIGGLSVNVGAVIGIATCNDGKHVAGDIIRAAEQAMQLCETGQTVRRFDTAMGEAARRRAFLRAELGHAIQAGQIWVAYQPKVDLRTGRIAGMEALARWSHPEAGPISPVDFVPIAERSGQIIPLSNLVLKTAIGDCARWNRTGLGPLKVAVNVSPVQLLGQDVGALVRSTLTEFDLDPRFLEIEITESTVMQDDNKAMRALDELRAMGISIAIDDFGTGYSSLSYLKRLPVDVLKIDRAFVRDLPDDLESLRLARAILGLSQDFGFNTVAEGVETAAQLAFLKEGGCNFGQGFFFSKPLSAEAFEVHMRNSLTVPMDAGND